MPFSAAHPSAPAHDPSSPFSSPLTSEFASLGHGSNAFVSGLEDSTFASINVIRLINDVIQGADMAAINGAEPMEVKEDADAAGTSDLGTSIAVDRYLQDANFAGFLGKSRI